MIRLVAWDWNGTLLADTAACMGAGNHVIKTYGGKPLSRKEYAEKFDFPSVEFYCAQGCDREALIAGVSDTFHDFYERAAARCRTREGARETLEWLRERSVPSVILSNHMRDAINRQLTRLYITSYFEEVLANTDLGATAVGHNKIQRMADYLARTGTAPNESVIIGDSTEDVRIGKELGMKTIAIEGGYFSTRRLRNANPDRLIGALSEIVGILPQL